MHRLAEKRAEVLVHVGLARQPAEAADRVDVVHEVAEDRAHHLLGQRPPERVHDHRPGLVVEAVAVGVEAGGVAAHPVVEQGDDLRRRGRWAPGPCAARG